MEERERQLPLVNRSFDVRYSTVEPKCDDDDDDDSLRRAGAKSKTKENWVHVSESSQSSRV